MKRLVRPLSVLIIGVMCACASTNPRSTKAQRQNGPADTLYSLNLMREGSLLLQQGRFEDALKRFHEANETTPGNATVHNMLGLCYLRLERYDAALQSFDQALQLIPSFTDARNNRGATYLALEQYKMAEIEFLAVLGDRTYPHRWEAYYNLGMTYLEQGSLGAAEDNFRRAASAPAPVFDAFLRLADVAQLQGKIEVALDVLDDARIAFPERVEASLQLGRLLHQTGRERDAVEHLQDVIDRAPGTE